MRQSEFIVDPIAVDADGLAKVQTLTASGGGDITLNGDMILTTGTFLADYPRRIGVVSSGDDSGITFTIVGSDPDGKALSEIVTGASIATATSVGYFETVTAITASGAVAANVSAGTVDEISTATFPLNTYNSDPATVTIEGVTGTVDYSIVQTFSRVQYSDIVFFATAAGLTAETANATGELSNHASGLRVVINSYTTGAEFKVVVNQNNYNT